MKQFLNIAAPYRFEMNDFRAVTMIINVVLVMLFGFASAWFGFTLAIAGLIKDCKNPNRHLNDFLIHFSSLILNCYFLSLLY